MKKKVLVIVLALLTVCTLMCGCSSGKNFSNGTSNIENDSLGDFFQDSTTDMETEESTTDSAVSTNRKIIEKVFLSAQTKEFDSLVEKLNNEIKTIGGYIENSQISGNSYSDYNSNRHARLIIRIPSEKSESFTSFVSKNSTVTNKEIETEDVTLAYVDTESRIKALNTEKETLERLLKNASSMDDVIKIQSRLTEVIYEIESYESKLRTYDNLIEYTTVTVNIYEVEKVAIVEKQNAWQKIWNNLKNNTQDIISGLVSLFVFFVSAIPYLIILGLLLIVVVVLYKKKKRNKLKSNQEQNSELKQ